MAYRRLFDHVGWTTQGRRPSFDEARQALVRRVVSTTCRNLGVIVHAVGTMPDRAHVAASIPPSVSLTEVIGRWKGSSSHTINRDATPSDGVTVAWRSEYGVFSLGERAMPNMLAYVQHQRERHGNGERWAGLERIEPPGTASSRL